MPNLVIEGTWEDLVKRQDLRGRRLRVVVVEEGNAEQGVADQTDTNSWVIRLREWAEGHPAVNHFVDDSRDVIYGGTVDDPR
jgi:hypothetical protein